MLLGMFDTPPKNIRQINKEEAKKIDLLSESTQDTCTSIGSKIRPIASFVIVQCVISRSLTHY